jgi:hypothetical protein
MNSFEHYALDANQPALYDPTKIMKGPVPCGSRIDLISLALRQGLYDDGAALYGLHYQLIAVEQGHTDKRVNVGFIHGNAVRFTVPNDYRLIDVEKAFASVC